MKPFAIAALSAAAFLYAPVGLVAQEHDEENLQLPQSWVFSLGGTGDLHLPSLTAESLDEFGTVENPSQFGFLDNMRWAAVLAITPSVYEEIVPVYSYSYITICDQSHSSDSDENHWPATEFIAGLGDEIDPGALLISPGSSPEAIWYASMRSVCTSDTDSFACEGEESVCQSISWKDYAKILKPIVDYSASQDQHGNGPIVVTATPLYGEEPIAEHWAVCNTNALTSDLEMDTACRLRLETSPFTRHHEILRNLSTNH